MSACWQRQPAGTLSAPAEQHKRLAVDQWDISKMAPSLKRKLTGMAHSELTSACCCSSGEAMLSKHVGRCKSTPILIKSGKCVIHRGRQGASRRHQCSCKANTER